MSLKNPSCSRNMYDIFFLLLLHCADVGNVGNYKVTLTIMRQVDEIWVTEVQHHKLIVSNSKNIQG